MSEEERRVRRSTRAMSVSSSASRSLARAPASEDVEEDESRARGETLTEDRRAAASWRRQSDAVHRVVHFATTMPNTITHKIMLERGWREVAPEDSNWDLFYADVGWIHENIHYKTGARLADHQRVNHFPNHAELTRKDLMAKNLNRAKRQAAKEGGAEAAKRYDILPQTFVMPQEALMMKRAFRDRGGLWIMKPIGRAQGRGIFVVSKLSQITAWLAEREKNGAENICCDNYVAQRYIANPYCVGGRKFDIRLYVLVLSFRPLRAYLYREGFARFTSVRYTRDKASLNDHMVHLTNHSVQKRDARYDAEKCDLRWNVRSLRQYIASKHGTATSDALIVNITELILRSLRSVVPVMINDRHCFELYGYDVMLDEDLRPWLIEVNASPSMSVDSAGDRALKTALFQDVLNVVDMERRFHRQGVREMKKRVGGFDLIHDGDVVEDNLSSLGALNDDRDRSLEDAKVECV